MNKSTTNNHGLSLSGIIFVLKVMVAEVDISNTLGIACSEFLSSLDEEASCNRNDYNALLAPIQYRIQ